MQILAIESSSLTAGAAIIKDDVVLAEYSVSFKKTHSQTLLPMIDEVVKMTETNLKELDAIAISAGPGSFTGLRIGSATAKGLCLALDKPLVEVSTLEAMAFGCGPFKGLICPVIDARRRQVYTALYRFNEKMEMVCVMEPALLLVEELAQKLKEYEGAVLFTGDGIYAHGEWLKENVANGHIAPAVCSTPRAAAVAELGKIKFLAGKAINADDHRPIYLKKSQAEQEREAGIYTKGSLRPGESGTEAKIC